MDCVSCATLYTGMPIRLGKLGKAPNKYCYRVKCQDRGIAQGHINSNKRTRPDPGGGGGGPSGAPVPEQMGRAEPLLASGAALFQVHEIYGIRLAARPRRPLCPTAFECQTDCATARVCTVRRARRAVDPARMSEREKRNTVLEADRVTESEYLVYGSFREDSDDDGFSTTRWLRAEQLVGIEGADASLDELEDLVTNTREMFFHE